MSKLHSCLQKQNPKGRGDSELIQTHLIVPSSKQLYKEIGQNGANAVLLFQEDYSVWNVPLKQHVCWEKAKSNKPIKSILLIMYLVFPHLVSWRRGAVRRKQSAENTAHTRTKKTLNQNTIKDSTEKPQTQHAQLRSPPLETFKDMALNPSDPIHHHDLGGHLGSKIHYCYRGTWQ